MAKKRLEIRNVICGESGVSGGSQSTNNKSIAPKPDKAESVAVVPAAREKASAIPPEAIASVQEVNASQGEVPATAVKAEASQERVNAKAEIQEKATVDSGEKSVASDNQAYASLQEAKGLPEEAPVLDSASVRQALDFLRISRHTKKDHKDPLLERVKKMDLYGFYAYLQYRYPDGQGNITLRSLEKDLGVSQNYAAKMILVLEECGLIEAIRDSRLGTTIFLKADPRVPMEFSKAVSSDKAHLLPP